MASAPRQSYEMIRQVLKPKAVSALTALSICLSFLIAWTLIGIPLVELMWWLSEITSRYLSFEIYEFLESKPYFSARSSTISSWGALEVFIFYLGWKKPLFHKGLITAHLLAALRFTLSFVLGFYYSQSNTDSGTYDGTIIGVFGFTIALLGLALILWPQRHFRNSNTI